MLIYLIKSKSLKLNEEDIICAYNNEESAKQHIKAYEGIYAKDLKSFLWYECLELRTYFK